VSRRFPGPAPKATERLARACARLGLKHWMARSTLYVELKDRTLVFANRGGAGVVTVRAFVDGELDAEVSMTEEKARA
jgi:hypothetical protein